jgi:hypothetical protein
VVCAEPGAPSRKRKSAEEFYPWSGVIQTRNPNAEKMSPREAMKINLDPQAHGNRRTHGVLNQENETALRSSWREKHADRTKVEGGDNKKPTEFEAWPKRYGKSFWEALLKNNEQERPNHEHADKSQSEWKNKKWEKPSPIGHCSHHEKWKLRLLFSQERNKEQYILKTTCLI